MAYQCLQLVSLDVPEFRSRVLAASQYLPSLGIPTDFTDAVLMPDQAGKMSRLVDAVNLPLIVGPNTGKHCSSGVECNIEHLVAVVIKTHHGLSYFRVPKQHCSVQAAGSDVISAEFENGFGEFLFVSLESFDANSASEIPNFGGAIEASSEDSVAFRGEGERNDFPRMSHQIHHHLPVLDIPQLARLVHASSGQDMELGLEGNAHYFLLVSSESVQTLSLQTPYFRSLVEAAGRNLVSIGIVEAETIDDVFVALQGGHQIPGVSVPEFAGSVIGSGDKLGSVLIEGAVGERVRVCFEPLEQLELLIGVLGDFVEEFLDERDEIVFFGLRNQGLFGEDFID